jgi:hypothetical protein
MLNNKVAQLCTLYTAMRLYAKNNYTHACKYVCMCACLYGYMHVCMYASATIEGEGSEVHSMSCHCALILRTS